MNLAQAVDWVEQEIRPTTVDTPEIKRRLNLQNDHLARELRLPTRYLTNIDATQSFALPGSARPSGLVGVWFERNGQRIKVKNVATVSRDAPSWFRNTRDHRFVLYDPLNLTAPVTPYGFGEGDTLRLLVVVKPQPLDYNEDEIWDGQLPEHHELVPRRVAMELLRMVPGDDMVRRTAMMEHAMDRQMRAAFAKSWFVEGMS